MQPEPSSGPMRGLHGSLLPCLQIPKHRPYRCRVGPRDLERECYQMIRSRGYICEAETFQIHNARIE